MTRIDYIEHELKDVLEYWAKDYKPKPGEKIIHTEWFMDLNQGKVIFKVFVETKPDEGR